MMTDKFRLTRTPSDAIRMISDAIPVREEQWTLVETTSGSRKERRERIGDERGLEMRARRRRGGRGKMRRNGRGNAGGRKTEQIPRKVALRETADAMTSTLAYADLNHGHSSGSS